MVRDCLPIASLMMVLFAYGTVVGVFYHIFFFGKSHSIALKFTCSAYIIFFWEKLRNIS